MTKLIKNWEELSKVPANNKYKIIVCDYNGWIVPICDEADKENDFICNCPNNCDYFNHVYLSTHTFMENIINILLNYYKNTGLI